MTNFKTQLSQLINSCQAIFQMPKPDEISSKSIESKQKLKDFIFLWNNSSSKIALSSDTQISFSNFFNFGSSKKLVQQMCGKPNYILENQGINIEILVYLIKTKASDVRFELHFYNEKLFFINYTYLNISEIEKENVLNAIAEKYQIKFSDINVYEHVIIDKNGNGLLFENNGHFSVNYLSPNSKVSSLIKSYLSENKAVI